MTEKSKVDLVREFFGIAVGKFTEEWNKLSVKEKNYFVKEVAKEVG